MVFSPRATPRFADRAAAGRRLVPLLQARGFDRPLVYALPRGGMPVALPIAEALHAPLDLLLVRKLGVPWQPELGFGAIAEGLEEPLFNQDIIAAPESVAEFQGLADEVITAEAAPIRFGIGAFYQDFHQISDAEMLEMLAGNP